MQGKPTKERRKIGRRKSQWHKILYPLVKDCRVKSFLLVLLVLP